MIIPIYQIWKRIKMMNKISSHLKKGHYCYYSEFIYFKPYINAKELCIRIGYDVRDRERIIKIHLYLPGNEFKVAHECEYNKIEFKDIEEFDRQCQACYDHLEDLYREYA